MAIKAIRMPKWGLAMEEGTIIDWLIAEGDAVAEGDEILEIETTKITNVLEATNTGQLARIVAQTGEVMPVGAIIGVLTEGEVSQGEVDAFLADSPAVEVAAEDDEDDTALALQTVTANGRRINLAQAGSGRAVVLLHGFSGDHGNWLFALEDLKGAARVIAPDLPGHGASEKDVGDGSLATLADTVAAMLSGMEVSDAVVVGHSLGAAVAMRLALDHPALVGKLALVCPAGLPGGVVNDDFLSGIVRAEKARDVKKALQLLVRDPATVSHDMVDGVTRAIRLDGAQAALGVLRDRMLDGADFAALHGGLDALPPVTLMASHNDTIVGAPNLAALPEGWAVHWLDDAGHLPHLETAAEVNALLRALI